MDWDRISGSLFAAALVGTRYTEAEKTKLTDFFHNRCQPAPLPVKVETHTPVREEAFIGIKLSPARRHFSLEEKLEREASAFGTRKPCGPMRGSRRMRSKVNSKAAGGAGASAPRPSDAAASESAEVKTHKDMIDVFQKLVQTTLPDSKLTAEDSLQVAKVLVAGVSGIKGSFEKARRNAKLIKDPLIQELVLRIISKCATR